jgi:hypothetical protein
VSSCTLAPLLAVLIVAPVIVPAVIVHKLADIALNLLTFICVAVIVLLAISLAVIVFAAILSAVINTSPPTVQNGWKIAFPLVFVTGFATHKSNLPAPTASCGIVVVINTGFAVSISA